MSVVMKAVGFDLLKRRAAGIENDLRRREQLNRQAVAVVDRWIQENFAAAGRLAMRGGWKPLSETTLARRRPGGGSGRHLILQDTGALKTSWKHYSDAKLAKVQAGVDYADEHHFGKGRLPKRRVLPTDKQIWPRLEKLYRGFVKKILVR